MPVRFGSPGKERRRKLRQRVRFLTICGNPVPDGSAPGTVTVRNGPLWKSSTPASSHPPTTRSMKPLADFSIKPCLPNGN